MACLISPTVFITNGPCAATGSLIGAPDRINNFTSLFASIVMAPPSATVAKRALWQQNAPVAWPLGGTAFPADSPGKCLFEIENSPPCGSALPPYACASSLLAVDYHHRGLLLGFAGRLCRVSLHHEAVPVLDLA